MHFSLDGPRYWVVTKISVTKNVPGNLWRSQCPHCKYNIAPQSQFQYGKSSPVLRASDSRKSQGNDLWQNCTHTKRTASSHSQSSRVMRDTKTWRTIGVPVLGFGCLWSLQRRNPGKVLWMDNRPGASRAAGSVLSDQVVVMPRHGAADDKHLLLVPWSLISFQLDSKGPIHLWHLDSVPRGVCRFFLSEPTRGNEDIIIFSLVSLHSFFPLLLFPAALWGRFDFCIILRD